MLSLKNIYNVTLQYLINNKTNANKKTISLKFLESVVVIRFI